MKSLIILLTLGLSHFSAASGCGGWPGSEITNIEVLDSQEINNYKVLAWAPGIIQIQHAGEKITLVSPEMKRINQYPPGKMYLERLKFHEYDGCEEFIQRETNRYRFEVKDYYIEGTFFWPIIKEFQSIYAEYNYFTDALLNK